VPYFVTDTHTPDEQEPVYKTLFQRLRLDKERYGKGDSVFGYVDFKILETTRPDSTAAHYGKGYFRGRVERDISPR